jgi:hypothetical protein
MDQFDEQPGDLDPHRREELAAVGAGIAARLRRRGIDVSGDEDAAELDDLLTAVERFEAAVEMHGGDLMVDDLRSSQPDDVHFVIPPRNPGERLTDYILRIDAARDKLRHHPRRVD